MGAAADAEDKTEKHLVTPGPLASELYGEMLLEVVVQRRRSRPSRGPRAKESNRFRRGRPRRCGPISAAHLSLMR
jgi:hypothetical protein